MDRRQLLALGSSVAVAGVPLIASDSAANATGSAAPSSRGVDFTVDGLGLTPHEYATLLGQVVNSQEIHPDYYSNGGLVEELEATFARLLGRERAIFVGTGTLANQLAVRALAGSDRRVLVQAESHLYNDSGDCLETLSGLNLIPLGAGQATLDRTEVRSWLERSANGRVETRVGVISIENPVRRMDHQMFDASELAAICSEARARGIRLHLDGARLFTLPLHSRISVSDHAAPFDTVYVSLWKHFNGASGAILAGDGKVIQGMYHTRRMFGGSLPQAWPGVALVPRYLQSFADDYARAWGAADELIALFNADRRFKVQRVPNGTSRFLLEVPGIAPELLAERLLRRGVTFPHPKPGTAVFPLQVNPTLLRSTPAALLQMISGSLAR